MSEDTGTTMGAAETLATLQKTASTAQQESRDAEWGGIAHWEFEKNTPLAMAKLISKMPWGPQGGYLTIPNALALALHWFQTGLNPFLGDIFILPSGKIGFSLQGMLKDAISKGYKLSAPRYTDVERPWPAGLVLEKGGFKNKSELSLPVEPGVTCEMEVNGQTVSFTTWLTEWYMPGNPNWSSRMSWMLRVQAQKRCLALGTGIAVSEEITDAETTSSNVDKGPIEPKAPKSIPFGAK